MWTLIFPKNTEELKKKAPQLMVVGFLTLGFLLIVADALEDVLIDGQPFSATLLFTLTHGTVLFTQNFTAAIASLGYAGVFGLMLLESSSLPVPSEVVLPFAGYLVYTGQLDFWPTVAVSTLAGVTGSLIDYYIGKKGLNLLAKQKTIERVLLNKRHLQTAENWFGRYGAVAVFLGRLAPGIRTLISFPAGAVKMPISKFIAYTAAGCLVWNFFLVYAGVTLGANWQQAAGFANYLIAAAAIAAVTIVVVFLIKRKRTKT